MAIGFDGEELATFPVRGVRGTPGSYQTRHVFTESGTYQTVLTFKKGEAEEAHTVDFDFTINPRSSLELPRRKGGGN